MALAIRMAFGLRASPLVSKDSQSYFLPAWLLVHAGEFPLGLRRTPGYPFFLSGALVWLGDDLRGIVLLQHLLGVGTAGLAFLLGRLTFGRAAGMLAGLLVALSAPLLVYEHYVLTESLFTFVLTAALVALVAAWRWPSSRRWLLAGGLVGLASLVRPVGQAMLPLALLAVVGAHPGSPRRWIVGGALVLAGFALPIVPWTIRNQLAHDLATPSTFGRTLIARTAYYDRGFVFYDEARHANDPDPRRLRARQIIQQRSRRGDPDGEIAGRLREELGLGPVEVNAVMRDLAVEAILDRPGHFLTGSLGFAVQIFNGVDVNLRDHDDERRDVVWDERTRHLLPPSRDRDADFRAAARQLGWYQPAHFAPLPLLLFALGLAASLVFPRWRPAILPGLAATMLVIASAALDGPQERYRYPADPAIGVMIGGGVVAVLALGRWLAAKLRGGRPSAVATAAKA